MGGVCSACVGLSVSSCGEARRSQKQRGVKTICQFENRSVQDTRYRYFIHHRTFSNRSATNADCLFLLQLSGCGVAPQTHLLGVGAFCFATSLVQRCDMLPAGSVVHPLHYFLQRTSLLRRLPGPRRKRFSDFSCGLGLLWTVTCGGFNAIFPCFPTPATNKSWYNTIHRKHSVIWCVPINRPWHCLLVGLCIITAVSLSYPPSISVVFFTTPATNKSWYNTIHRKHLVIGCVPVNRPWHHLLIGLRIITAESLSHPTPLNFSLFFSPRR